MKSIFYFCTLVWLGSSAFAKQNESCQSGLGLIPNGESVSGYTTSVSSPGIPCANSKTSVLCLNGVLLGPEPYSTCSDILQDCQGVSNGGSVTGYQSPVAPCISSTVTCSNGVLSGTLPFPSCTE